MLKFFLFLILFEVGFQIIAADSKCSNVESNGLKLVCYVESTTVKDIDICSCTHVILNNKIANKEYVHNLKTVNSKLKFLRELDISNTVTNISEDIFDGLLLKVKDKQQAEVKSNLTTIVQGLKSKNVIFMELPPFTQYLAKYYDLKALSKYVDLFILRTDSLNGREGTVFHPNRLSGLWDMLNADSLIDLVTGLGTEESKLAISTSMNVLKFTLKNDTQTLPGSLTSLDNNKPVIISQNDLCNLLNSTGNWTIERDEDQAGPYAFSGNKWVAFEDSLSLQIKAKYIRIRKLGGLAIYGLENDSDCDKDFPLLTITSKALFTQSRVPRGALLHSLERDIMSNEISRFIDVVSVSPYRITRVIDEEGHVHAIREDMKTHFSCSRQGYFVHPKSCGRFYRCVKFNQLGDDWSVFEFSCPTGLVFDSRWEVCVWPGSSPHACPGSSEITPVPRERFICPPVEGYYVDPENCRWFFACLDHGKAPFSAYEFRCPFGLVFDESRILCDWPWKVKGHCGSVGIVEGETYHLGSETLSLSGQINQNEIGIYSETNEDKYLSGHEVHFANIGIPSGTVQKTYNGLINGNEGVILDNIEQLSPVVAHENKQVEYHKEIISGKSGIGSNINLQGEFDANYRLHELDESVKTAGVTFNERIYQPIVSTEKPYSEETLLLSTKLEKEADHLLPLSGVLNAKEGVLDNYKVIDNINIHPTQRIHTVSFGTSKNYHEGNKNILLSPLVTSNSDLGIIGHNVDTSGVLTSVNEQQIISTPSPLHTIEKGSTRSNIELNSYIQPNVHKFEFVSSTPSTLLVNDAVNYGTEKFIFNDNKQELNNRQILFNQDNAATVAHSTQTIHNTPIKINPEEQNIKLTYSAPKSVLINEKSLLNSESLLNTYNTKDLDNLALNIQNEPKQFSILNGNKEFIQHTGEYQKIIPKIKYQIHTPIINEQNHFVEINDNNPQTHYVENSAIKFAREHEPNVDLIHSQINTPVIHSTSQFFGNRKLNLVPVQVDNTHDLYLSGLQRNGNYNSTYDTHLGEVHLINKNVHHPISVSTSKPFSDLDSEIVENINFEYTKPQIKFSPISFSTPQTYVEGDLNGNIQLDYKKSAVEISPIEFSTIAPVQKNFASFNVHSIPQPAYKKPRVQVSPIGFSTISPVQKTFESFSIHSTSQPAYSESIENVNLNYKRPNIQISPIGISTVSPPLKTHENFNIVSTPRSVEFENLNIEYREPHIEYREPHIKISPIGVPTVSPVGHTFENLDTFSVPLTVDNTLNKKVNLEYEQPNILISSAEFSTVSPPRKIIKNFNTISTARPIESDSVENINVGYREPSVAFSPIESSTISPIQETFETFGISSTPQTYVESDSLENVHFEYKKPNIKISQHGNSGTIHKINYVESTTHPTIIQENIQPVKLFTPTEPSTIHIQNNVPHVETLNQQGHNVHFGYSQRPTVVPSEYSQSTVAPIIQNINSFETGYSSTLKPEFSFVTEKTYSGNNIPGFRKENVDFDILGNKNKDYIDINNYELNKQENEDVYLPELSIASQFDSKKKVVEAGTLPIQYTKTQIKPTIQTYHEKYESVSPIIIEENFNNDNVKQVFVSSTPTPIKYVTEQVIPVTYSPIVTNSETIKYHNNYKVLPTKPVTISLFNQNYRNSSFELPAFTESLKTIYSSPSPIIDNGDSIELIENEKQDYVPEYEGVVYKHPVQHINKNRIIVLPETDHPYLITKLGATCHCVSNNLKLRQKSAGIKRPVHLVKINGNRGLVGVRNTTPKQIFLESVTPTVLTSEIKQYSVDNKIIDNLSSTSSPLQSSDLVRQINWGPGFIEKITPSEYFIKNIQPESQDYDRIVSSTTAKTLNADNDFNIHYISSTSVPFETNSLTPQTHLKTVTEVPILVDSSPDFINVEKIDIPKTVVIKPAISSTPINIKTVPVVTTPASFVTKTVPVILEENQDSVEIKTSEPKFSIPIEVADRRGSIGISLPFERYGFGGRRDNDETLQGTLDCTRPGLFRHPHHCDKFYSCRWDCNTQRFTLHVFNCPVRLSFDESQGACNWPHNGPACQHDTLIFSRK